MNKVICDICGTSYPETAEQCPICGYAPGAAVEPIADDEEFVLDDILLEEDTDAAAEASEEAEAGFAAPVIPAQDSLETEDDEEDEDEDDEEEEEGGKRRPSAFLIALLVIVIIALLGLTGFIFAKYYLPGMRAEATEPTTVPTTEEFVETAAPTVPCTSLAMTSDSEVLLDKPGNNWLINVVAMPEDTTDEIIFLSNNLDVVTVDADGTVTAVGEGSAVISVICGEFTVECNVTCAFVTESSVPDETGTEPNDGDATDPTDADATEEATEEGETTAPAEGETEAPTEEATEAPTEEATEAPTEEATEAPTEEPTEAPTEAPTEPADGVKLELSKTDISFDRVGVYYTLKVKNGIDPKDVEWITSHSGVCVVEDGVITVTGPGMAKITAKYNGQEATCIVRVTVSKK